MTREEAVIILDGFKNNPLFNEQHFEAFDMAISALSNNGNSISRQAVLNTLDNMEKALDEDRTVEKYKELLTECIKMLPSAENKGDLIRQAEDYENEIADLHNRLDIAEYDKERYKEEITILEAENKGEWIYDKSIYNWRCSRCGQTPPQTGYVGTAYFMATHFKFCSHCGADMRGE